MGAQYIVHTLFSRRDKVRNQRSLSPHQKANQKSQASRYTTYTSTFIPRPSSRRSVGVLQFALRLVAAMTATGLDEIASAAVGKQLLCH